MLKISVDKVETTPRLKLLGRILKYLWNHDLGTLAITISNVVATFTTYEVYGTITPTGNYATGGDTLSFASQDQIKSSSLPTQVEIYSAHSTTTPQTNMFVYNYAPGTSQANGKMQVFTGAAAQTALTELSAGAYPAGVTADTIQFHATFPKNI